MKTVRRPVAGFCCAVVALTAATFIGCESASKSRQSRAESPDLLARKVAEARQVAVAAAETASKAAKSRQRGDDADADRFSHTAIEQYRRAIALSPDMPEVWNNLGVELMRVQDYLGASEAFSMAMQLSPSDPRPAENIALVYDRTGWAEESLRYYDIALERSPNYLPALRGAIKASHLLSEADENRLDQVRRALMIETDPKLREFFEREQVRILGRLERNSRQR